MNLSNEEFEIYNAIRELDEEGCGVSVELVAEQVASNLSTEVLKQIEEKTREIENREQMNQDKINEVENLKKFIEEQEGEIKELELNSRIKESEIQYLWEQLNLYYN